MDAPTAAALLRGLQAGSHAAAACAVIDVLASPRGGRPPQAALWPVLIAACEAVHDWRRALELALVSFCARQAVIFPGFPVLKAGSDVTAEMRHRTCDFMLPVILTVWGIRGALTTSIADLQGFHQQSLSMQSQSTASSVQRSRGLQGGAGDAGLRAGHKSNVVLVQSSLRTIMCLTILAAVQCMEDCGVAPDTKTLNCVLVALHVGEQPDLVLSLVQHMKSVSPSSSYHHIVGLFHPCSWHKLV